MKILDLTTDSFILPLNKQGVDVVHCQTGNSILHSGCPKKPGRWAFLRLAFEILRARRYDFVFVPPTHVTWNLGNGFLGRNAKRILARGMKFPQVSRFLRHLIFGRNAHFVIIDYSDQLYPSEFGLKCIEPAHYFMINAPTNLVGRKTGPADSRVHYLPSIIDDTFINSLIPSSKTERINDVFVAGYYHNNQRIKQQKATEILGKRGWTVFELEEKSFGKFKESLHTSKLCMAGRGTGYHCLRMLEAAASGAAPICHTPEEGTHHEWVHEKNCFLYDHSLTPEEIADFVESILRNPQSISRAALGAWNLLNSHHRASALSKNIYDVLISEK